MTFNASQAKLLAAALAEADAKMTPGPYSVIEEPQGKGRRSFRVLDANGMWVAECDDAEPDAHGITTLRNHAATASAQLLAACEEIERLTKERNAARRHLDGSHPRRAGQGDAVSDAMQLLVEHWQQQLDAALADRARLEGEVARLTANLNLSGPDSACCRARHRAEDDVARLQSERDAAIREADRWRHGVPVEGDFVCPRDLEADRLESERDEAVREVERMRGVYEAARTFAARHNSDFNPDGPEMARARIGIVRAVAAATTIAAKEREE